MAHGAVQHAPTGKVQAITLFVELDKEIRISVFLSFPLHVSTLDNTNYFKTAESEILCIRYRRLLNFTFGLLYPRHR